MKRQLIVLALILVMFSKTGVALAEGVSYTCNFNFVMENRFPCSGSPIIDGDGIARFTVKLSHPTSRSYRLKITQVQPAVFMEDNVNICNRAINRTYRTTARLRSNTKKELRLSYFDGNLFSLTKPLTSSIEGRFSWVFGYSGASSRASMTSGTCQKNR